MKKKYILSIDQSTQGTKSILFDAFGNSLSMVEISHKQIINDNGWVSHDLNEIAENVEFVTLKSITNSGIDPSNINAIGITNQRETVGLWDRKTGRPVSHSIVWQCNRASDICELVNETDAKYIFETTGLQLSPFFSAAKIAWILENVPGVRKKAENGDLCCGTMDSWVIFCLTNGQVHKTDLSNATRTQLVNLKTCNWDKHICEIFNIPMIILPEICDSDSFYGVTDFKGSLKKPIQIHTAIGDSNAALFAIGCHSNGDSMIGYGTGSSVMMNIGNQPLLSNYGLSTSVSWKANNKTNYMLSGVINYSGAVINWLINDLGLIKSPSETDDLASMANPSDKTYLVPSFTGIGAPHWSNRANAVFSGMTRITGRPELIRASLESIAYQIADVVFSMSADADINVDKLYVSGGPTNNKYLMQFQSDILNCEIIVPANKQMTLQGTAYMTGIASNIYEESIVFGNKVATRYHPKISLEKRKELLLGWKKAVQNAIRM